MPITRRLSCLLTFACLAAGLSASAAEKKVLLIGIDGTRFDAVSRAEAPHLKALAKEGIVSDTCLILGERYRKNDTISGPGWSSICTGVWADKHGVHDNSFQGRKYEQFPHFFARLKEVRPKARAASFVTWEPIQKFIVSAADAAESFEQKAHGVLDYDKYDTAAAAAAVQELTGRDPDVVFLYLGQVDVAGHTHGFHPTVPEYLAAIERADALVGKALAAMRGRKSFAQEDWLVVVTSDHGGQGKGHSRGHESPEILNSFLIVSGASAQRGRFAEQVYLVDAPVTALAHLGVTAKAEWKLDGRPVGLKGVK